MARAHEPCGYAGPHASVYAGHPSVAHANADHDLIAIGEASKLDRHH